jgi:hypothetical protein
MDGGITISVGERAFTDLKKVGIHFQYLRQLEALNVQDLVDVDLAVGSLNDLNRSVDGLQYIQTQF